MKFTTVLSACNNNPEYACFISYFIDSWKKLFPEVKCIVIYIDEIIPENLKKYEENIILFKPLPGISTKYISQNIRLYYPALLNVDGGVMITDIDMIPLNRDYYLKNIDQYDDDIFIVYRKASDDQFAMCYCLANSKVWGKTFDIKNIEDINKYLTENGKFYTGVKGDRTWFFDQIILTIAIRKYQKYVILNDKKQNFNRLDREYIDLYIKNSDKILKSIKMGKYSDFHLPKIEYKEFIEKVIYNL